MTAAKISADRTLAKKHHQENSPKLIALFGGTFDPIHNGHLQTVDALQQAISLDEVRWVVSAKPPHRDSPNATPEERMEMLTLALEPYAKMVGDDIELKRSGPSYTVLTLQAYRQQFPNDHIVLVVGADVMESFHTWHQSEKIIQLAHMVVMHRPSYESDLADVLKPFETKQVADLKKTKHGKVFVYPAPAVPVSATAIREKMLKQESIDGLVPPAVANFIKDQKLYRSDYS